MIKRLSSFLIAICAALLLFPTVLADNGNQDASAAIRAVNPVFSGADGSFQIVLSDAEIQGSVFVSVYAESGKMKSVERYDAAETLSVKLDKLSDTDLIKAIWTNENDALLACSEVSRTEEMESVDVKDYNDFADAVLDMMREYEDFSIGGIAQSDIGEDGMLLNEYAFARLVVRSEKPLPDLSEYNVAKKISDAEGHTVLQFTSAERAKACADYLRKYIPENDENNYVMPDSIVRVDPNASAAASSDSLSWGVPVINADGYAFSLLERGINRNITVAVIDTGVDYTHEFLQNRTVSGYDYVANDSDPMDEHYHGTHVAGTIVDCSRGLDNLKIMPVRVLDSGGSGSYLNVSFGIRYAADHGADVINMSLGGGHGSVIDEAVNYAVSKNVIVVVAAGNESDDAENHCPSHIRQCITVAAVDKQLSPAYFTNYGEPVDIAAPGVNIKSCVPNGGYRELSGTSMASPHVAACAALLLEDHPDLTPAQAEEMLTANPTVPNGWNSGRYYGKGVVHMDAEYSDPDPEEFYAILYSDGEMVFQNSNTPESGRNTLSAPYPVNAAASAQYALWYSLRNQIRTVTFAEEVHPASTALWFYQCENLKTINHLENLKTESVENMSQMFSRCSGLTELDLSVLDTGNVKNMSQMFFRCSALRTLDLRGWNTGNVVRVEDMFSGCENLETIAASGSFTTSNVTDGNRMFEKCASLKGENGTTYSDSRIDKTYARIDSASAPGYFSTTLDSNPPITPAPTPNETIYAVLYPDGELAFLNSPDPESGRDYIKKYEADAEGYSADRANENYYTAWYNEADQIRSVRFAADIYPTSTALWFYDCKNLTSIVNPAALHTDYVTDMSQMFAYCGNLTSLDLSGFNTVNVENAAFMFYRCSALETIYASDAFTTTKITDSESMFEDCASLKGGRGTSYSENYIDKTYARIDSVEAAGYFTAK